MALGPNAIGEGALQQLYLFDPARVQDDPVKLSIEIANYLERFSTSIDVLDPTTLEHVFSLVRPNPKVNPQVKNLVQQILKSKLLKKEQGDSVFTGSAHQKLAFFWIAQKNYCQALQVIDQGLQLENMPFLNQLLLAEIKVVILLESNRHDELERVAVPWLRKCKEDKEDKSHLKELYYRSLLYNLALSQYTRGSYYESLSLACKLQSLEPLDETIDPLIRQKTFALIQSNVRKLDLNGSSHLQEPPHVLLPYVEAAGEADSNIDLPDDISQTSQSSHPAFLPLQKELDEDADLAPPYHTFWGQPYPPLFD